MSAHDAVRVRVTASGAINECTIGSLMGDGFLSECSECSESKDECGVSVMLRLHGCRVVVIGAGAVASRKIARLLKANAWVVVISPHVCDAIASWVAQGCLEWIARRYQDGDLEDAWFVCACTDDVSVHERVVDEAARRRIFTNVAAAPALGTTTWMATRRLDEGLTVAVDTHGASAALAIAMCERLTQGIEESWGKAARVLRKLRSVGVSCAFVHDPPERRHAFWRALARTLPDDAWGRAPDVLAMLMLARKESGTTWSDEELEAASVQVKEEP